MFWDDEVFEKEAQRQRERTQWKAGQKSKSSTYPSSGNGARHSSSGNGNKGNRPYAKAKFRLHPDADFDPSEYLLADEIQNHRPPSKFRDALRRHRWGLYRIYGVLLNVTYVIQKTDIKQLKQFENLQKSKTIWKTAWTFCIS